MTNCSSDVADFKRVEIHTAKCSVCDARNDTDQMRRCKGCGWQICKPCQDKREAAGRSLTHGNAPTPSFGTPLVRRKLFNPIQLDGNKEKDEAAQEAPPPTSAEKRKLEGKVNQKAPVVETPTDDEPLSEPESPTTDRKRRRTGNIAHSSSMGVGGSPLARHVRLSSSQLPPTSRPPQSSGSGFVDVQIAKGMSPSKHMETVQAYYRLPTGTDYEQHLLSRNQPVTTNPTVRIPPNVARNFKPRKTGEEMMHQVREKVRENLAGGASAQFAPASVSTC